MKSRPAFLFCAAGAAILFCTGLAWAQDGPRNGSGPRHGGGPGGMMPSFAVLDADSNGKVTQEEFTTAMNKQQTKAFTRFDADGDGVLSASELPKGPGPRPGQGGDPPAPPDGQDAAANTPPPMPPGDRGAGFRPPRPEDFDANKDGSVTQEEFLSAWSKPIAAQFTALDTNGDKALSEDEVANAQHRRGGPGQPGGGSGFGGDQQR